MEMYDSYHALAALSTEVKGDDLPDFLRGSHDLRHGNLPAALGAEVPRVEKVRYQQPKAQCAGRENPLGGTTYAPAVHRRISMHRTQPESVLFTCDTAQRIQHDSVVHFRQDAARDTAPFKILRMTGVFSLLQTGEG